MILRTQNRGRTGHCLHVIALLPVLGQPRHAKRIDMLCRAGFSVTGASFERDYHSGRFPSVRVHMLGRIHHGRYAVRAWGLIKALPKLRKLARGADVLYAFGADMAVLGRIALIFSKTALVVEVGDIRSGQVAPGWRGRLLRLVDRWITGSASLLVVTAKGFLDEYYRQRLGVGTKAMVIENKLEDSVCHAPREGQRGRAQQLEVLRIGYFGLLRCEWSWEVLELLAKTAPDRVHVVVAGFPMEPKDIPARAEAIGNVEYLGEYRSPDDLARLYGLVDLVWACYPLPSANEQNWRWARTNRFYECCAFQVPMIVLSGSGDSGEVKRRDIGIEVKADRPDLVVQELLRVTGGDVDRWRRNLCVLDSSVYQYGEEYHCLAMALMSAAGRRELTEGLP